MRLLITGPARTDPGGVSAFYNAVLPELSNGPDSLEYLEIGGTLRRGGVFSPLVDQWRFRSVLGKVRPDIYLCNPSLDPRSFFRDGLFVAHAARRGIPVVVFFHGWRDDFAATVERRWSGFFRRTFGKASAFVVLASRFRDRLRGWGVTAPIELGVTAVSSDLLADLPAQSYTPPDSSRGEVVRILFLARLERAKGIGETLEAFRQLREQGSSVTLTIAGDGAARADVQLFLQSHAALAPLVTMTGDVRGVRKREILASHDIYCFPSYTEGMPASVLEAMAFGLPVVTAPVGGLADFFEDGRMGCLLPRVESAALAAALKGLASNADVRHRMGAYNRSYALEHFTARAAAERLMSVCRAASRQIANC